MRLWEFAGAVAAIGFIFFRRRFRWAPWAAYFIFVALLAKGA